MTLEEKKEKIITRAEKLKACSDGIRGVRIATTDRQLLCHITDNIDWVSRNNLFGEELGLIDNYFTNEELIEAGIANTGNSNTGYSNTGDWNTGYSNTGDWNTGNSNTGNSNTGNSNTGNSNTGDWNTGNSNTGNSNTGDRNTGDWNTGDWNTGDWNTGYSNTGDWNTGYSNTGDWNTGNRNTGLFNRDTPKLRIFEQESEWTIEDWHNSEAFDASVKFILTKWVSSSDMTDDEKASNPTFYVQDGFLKKFEFKDACKIWWNSLSDREKNSFKEIPNFNLQIFEEITGCNFNQ